MIIAPGAASRSITVYAYDATTGLPYSTAAYNDAGIALWYRRGVTGAKTAITPASLSALTDAYSSGGFKAIAENAYRLDVPDAAWASGADMVVIGGSATAWKLIPIEVALETPQTGDSYARIGAAGAGLTAVVAASVTGNVGGNVTGSVGSVATGGITAGSIAADAIGASELAADAVAEIAAAISVPTAAAVADAVWDEALSGHATAGTAGDALSDAGATGDPMDNVASGYASGTLGYIISSISGGRVTVTSPVSTRGDMAEIVAGADYHASDGTAFDWTNATGAWPDLTAATVTWNASSPDGDTAAYSMTVTDATGDTKTVRLALTSTQTAALATAHVGSWEFGVWATLSNGRKYRLASGSVPVTDGPGPS